MTPPNSDGPMCPLPGCNQGINEKSLDELKEVVQKGFGTMQEIQSQRTENDVWTKHLLDQSKEQNSINRDFFDKYSELLKQLARKVDEDTLTNAMETVQKNIAALKFDMKWYNDTLKKDMKWFITFSLGGVTLAIAAINYFSK